MVDWPFCTPLAQLDRVRLRRKPEGGGSRLRRGARDFSTPTPLKERLKTERHATLSSMYVVYVLRSESTGRHYVGFTADLTQRLGQHNSGVTKSTKNRGPWVVIYQERCPTRSAAMTRERYWKSGQGREELKRILSSCGPGSVG